MAFCVNFDILMNFASIQSCASSLSTLSQVSYFFANFNCFLHCVGRASIQLISKKESVQVNPEAKSSSTFIKQVLVNLKDHLSSTGPCLIDIH